MLVEEVLGGDVDQSFGTSFNRVLMPPDHVHIRALLPEGNLAVMAWSTQQAGVALGPGVILTQHRGTDR